MLEELQENPTGGQRQQYRLVFTFCPSRRWQDWKRQRKGTKKGWEIQVQLTTTSSQQAVEGSFLLIPKKTSSVPTHCLNKIWYLRKRNSCLIILEKGQETKGDGISQRTVNILIAWSLLLFKASTHLRWVSVQSHDWLSQKTGEDHSLHLPKALTLLPPLTSLCRIRKCILTEYDTYQLVKYHKLLGNRFQKDAVAIICVLFCLSTYSCRLSITVFCQIVIVLHLANIYFLPLHIYKM